MHLSFTLFNGEEYTHFTELKVLTVGRSSKCDIVVPFIGISRRHFQLEVENGEIFITDLGSTNGVYIDGEKIPPHVKIRYNIFLPFSFGYVSNMHIQLELPKQKTSSLLFIKDFDQMTMTNIGLGKTSTGLDFSKDKKAKDSKKNSEVLSKKSNSKTKSQKNTKIRFWILNIITLAAFGAVVFIYYLSR
jgi:hypothetical protein